MRVARILLVVLATCAALAGVSGTAQAAAIYGYHLGIDLTGADQPAPGGNLGISNLDPAKDTKVIVNAPGGANRLTVTQASGGSSFSSGTIAGLQPGDVVTVRQPSASVSPTETYTIPALSVNVVNGASTITGVMPDGMAGGLIGDYRCDMQPPARTFSAGPFSMPYSKILPGEVVNVNAYDAIGDSMYLTTSSPGETPCINVSASGRVNPPPGSPPDPAPYHISVDHLLQGVSPSTRVVLHRGATVLLDTSADSTYISADFGIQPLPGDTVDVYRPKTAPAPSYSATIPAVSAKFDAAADLVAVDAPASGLVYGGPCRAYGCTSENTRSVRGTPAGRTLLNFAQPEGVNSVWNMLPDDFVYAQYTNPDFTFQYDLRAVPGDLVAPVQSFKLSSKLKASSLIKLFKKGFKLKLKSNEAAKAKLTLAFPSSKTSAAAKSKSITIASVSKSVKAGTTTLKLKFTKSGKKAIKKLAGAGRHGKSRSAVLTSIVTDASGNSATATKNTTIKP